MGPGATFSTASAAVEAVLASVTAVSQREKLHIARFGTFETIERPESSGFDINTGSRCTRPARSVLTFRPASEFLRNIERRRPAQLPETEAAQNPPPHGQGVSGTEL